MTNKAIFLQQQLNVLLKKNNDETNLENVENHTENMNDSIVIADNDIDDIEDREDHEENVNDSPVIDGSIVGPNDLFLFQQNLERDNEVDDDAFENDDIAPDVSEDNVYTLLLLLQDRHQLSNAAITDIANLLNVVNKSKKFFTTYRTIQKKSKIFSPVITKHFFINGPCEITGEVQNLEKPATCINNCNNCPVILPRSMLQKDGCSSYFCSISLKQWLKFIVPVFYKSMKFPESSPTLDNVSDITDSKEYKRLMDRATRINLQNGTNHRTITLTLGYDGAVFTKDSSSSVYPIVAYLNELPLNLRLKNAVTVAVYAGRKKPKSSAMFKKVVEELKIYDKEAIEITIDGKKMFFYVRLLLFIGDAPVRADILNLSSFNSEFGCNRCLVQSVYHQQHKTFRYPFKESIADRSDIEWRRIITNINNGTQIENRLGVKGMCPFADLEYVKLPLIAPGEFLHSQLIGKCNKLF